MTDTTAKHQSQWIKELTRHLGFIESRYANQKARFEKKLAADGISEAIGWYGDDVVAAEAEWNLYHGLTEILASDHGDDAKLVSCREWAKEVKTRMLTAFSLGNSTSPFANVVKNTSVEARMRTMSPMGGSFTMVDAILSDTE